MSKKCPPGVFCIENYTLGILSIIIFFVLFYLWKSNNNNSNTNNSNTNNSNNNDTNNSNFILDKMDNILSKVVNTNNTYTRPNSIFTNDNSVLLNPYVPPLRENRRIPINIRTQGEETEYQQIGILTRINGPETILPLMGKSINRGRDMWNFYTINDKNNMIKLPITFRNRNCSSEHGCDNLSNGDTVFVEGFNDTFRATIYENNTMRYIPYI